MYFTVPCFATSAWESAGLGPVNSDLFTLLGAPARCIWSSFSRLVADLRAAAGISRVARSREVEETIDAVGAAVVSFIASIGTADSDEDTFSN